MNRSVSPPEAAFQAEVEHRLDRHAADLVAVLRRVISHSYPSEVAGISFEVFSDGFEETFPVHMYLMDADDWFLDPDGHGLPYSPPVSPGLLDIDGVYGSELPKALHDASPDSDDWDLATGVLVRWFGRRWLEADGASFDRRAWIQHHDSIFRFDLSKQAWHKAEEPSN
jgi:hypothetical protein